MKKFISIIVAVVMILSTTITAFAGSVGSFANVSVGGGESPVVKAKWEQQPYSVFKELEDGDPLHKTPGFQLLPPVKAGAKKMIEYYAVVTDAEDGGNVAQAFADVYHPVGSPEPYGPSKTGGVVGYCPALPVDPVTVLLAKPGPTSYFKTMISGTAIPSINGTYEGWCTDTSSLHLEDYYSALAYCSYGTGILPFTLPPGFIFENIDLVNWVLNQGFVGKASPSGGVYDLYDVQEAIWDLLGQPYSTGDPVKVNEIVTAAKAHDGFTPFVGGVCAVFLVPVDKDGVQIKTAQLIIVALPVRDRQYFKYEVPFHDLQTGEGAISKDEAISIVNYAYVRGLITFNKEYPIAEVMYELDKGTAHLWMGEALIDYEQPAGMYDVYVFAVDTNNNLSIVLYNQFLYVPVAGIEVDFNVIDWGSVNLGKEKMVPGDLIWDYPAGINNATVRNIGNTFVSVQIGFSDMGFGQDVNGNWNVLFDARMGSDDKYYVGSIEPFTMITLPNALNLSCKDELDLSILIIKGFGAHRGEIRLAAVARPFNYKDVVGFSARGDYGTPGTPE